MVISDNGPQFSSERYSKFAEKYHFQHVTSSPYFPQSNGEAERAVGTIKRMLNKEKYLYLAYRSTPLQNGYCPSELLMSRKYRTTVPIAREQRSPKVPDMGLVKSKDKTCKKTQKQNYDKRHRSRELPPLTAGDAVWIPARETEAVVGEEVAPRSYEVTTSSGSTIRRNRRDLVTVLESSEEDTSPGALNIETDTTSLCDTDTDEEPGTTQDVQSTESRKEQPL